jgi:hypothetical protein
LSENIRQGWNCPTVTNTLTYTDTELITDVKVFMIPAQGMSILGRGFSINSENSDDEITAEGNNMFE